MPVHLSKEELVTIEVFAEKGQKKSEIARAMNVTEGTARYHLLIGNCFFERFIKWGHLMKRIHLHRLQMSRGVKKR